MLKKSKIIIVFVLVVSFLMNSCYKEEELESIDIQTAIKKRNISFEELNTKLNKYKKYKVHHGRAGGDGFITSLETNNIVEIETEVRTTYTLKANTTADDTTSFTNIIFVEKNGELEKYLLRYEPTEAWKIARLTDANILYSGNTIILDFDGTVLAESQVIDGITVSKTSASMTCYVFEEYTDYFFETYYVLVEVPCDEPVDDEIDAGDSGDGGGADTSGDGDGSTTSGTGTDGDSSNDDGTGNTADTGDDGNPIFTEPVIGDNDEDIIAQLNNYLCTPINASQSNFIINNPEIAEQLYNYLISNINPSQGECLDVDLDSLDDILNSGDFNIDDEPPNAAETVLFAIFHDKAALHIQNSITALNRSQELAPTFSDGIDGLLNGKADAFRHAFWNALGTAEFGEDLMKLFADAHEWGQTGTDVNMDYFNNSVGRNISINNNFGFFTDSNTISNAIIIAILTGTLQYINGNGDLIYTNE